MGKPDEITALYLRRRGQMSVHEIRAAEVLSSENKNTSMEMAVQMLFGGGEKDHWGDCIQVPMTCSRCLYDHYMRLADPSPPDSIEDDR